MRGRIAELGDGGLAEIGFTGWCKAATMASLDASTVGTAGATVAVLAAGHVSATHACSAGMAV